MTQTWNTPEASETSGANKQADQAIGIVAPLRRPCRICRVRDRPVVPIGCAAGWDLCFRCYRGVSHIRRHSEPIAVEAWVERVDELAEVCA
jgi:hypothetical protein